MPQAVIARSCTVARQVAEVRTSLAIVAPWLWLMKMKLAELPLTGLVWIGLVWTEVAQTELV